MKKFLSILLAFALLLTLAACSGDGDVSEAPLDTTEEDGQNPVMNFIGVYACDRCSVTVEAFEANGAKISVHWGSSAFESAEWEMTGPFDAENLSISYSDGVKKEVIYLEDGETFTEKTIYENGKGSFTFNEGDSLTLTWDDRKENCAEGMVFEFVPIEFDEGESSEEPMSAEDTGAYASLTSMPSSKVEEYAETVRQLYLNEDWETISTMIDYPIDNLEYKCENAEEFLEYAKDKHISQSDREAMEKLVISMNGEGMFLGNGEIWFRDINFDGIEQVGDPQLMIFGINGLE